MSTDRIIVQGAREHNLKNLHLELPREKLIVFTGLSGSGKSSLAFDTIYAEGQRRYVESLSAYARQFLGQMEKPDVDFIEGLSPAISIDQKTASRNPRSTVGTVTEIHDYLRLLFARIGIPHCPNCGRVVNRQTPQQIVDQILDLPEGARFQVLAPIVRGRKGEYEALLKELSREGFARARIDGEVRDLTDDIKLDRYYTHTIEVVVDRLARKPGIERRLTDSLETALRLADGVAVIDIVDGASLTFSQALACDECGLSFDELQPRNFSFNSPYGACETCNGIGTRYQVDPRLVVPDPDRSIGDGAISPWAGRHRMRYFARLLEAVTKEVGIDLDKPFGKLSKKHREVILHGLGDTQVTVSYVNRFGRQRRYQTTYEGAIPFLERRYQDSDSESARDQYQQYMRQVPCGTCEGARLNPVSLAVTIAGRNIFEVSTLSLRDAHRFLDEVKLDEREAKISEQVLKELRSRLTFLLDVGLDYLTLYRSAATLAGGEAQRIRLATQIGSGLVGVLYILDEPSIGLHQRDNKRLIETLVRLRDLGNTLIVVEHDEETIRTADHIVDIGPGAGEHGGQIVAEGSLAALTSETSSITGDYLAGRRSIEVPGVRRPGDGREIVVVEAEENNLQKIDVTFPLGMFIAVTGVSGSGKSTLVQDILHKALHSRLYRSREVPGHHRRVVGYDHIDKVINIDQSPIGRTPRSNPATYSGVFDRIREMFASTPDANMRGYKPGRFSFNVSGGRCENCKGDGTIKIEMHFLPDVYIPCEVCKGRRYNRETLEILWKGHSIADVLDMSVEEAVVFFENQPRIARILQTIYDVGLGYIRLGQPAPTLSGGEAQRVKLSSELGKRATGRTLYILDEPTTGLHFEDVRRLLQVLQRLVDTGNTVLVIEHNLDVVKSADYVIDLGPEGGDEGGRVVATGTPEQVAAVGESYTGKFLPRGARLSDDWDALAEWWSEEVHADPAYQEQVLPLLLEVLDPKPGERYLDLGCGEGQGMRAVAGTGAAVAGCDISSELLARAVPGIVVRCRLPDLRWVRPGAFTGMYAVLVLEHLAGLNAFFRGAAAASGPGGVLAVVLNHPAFTAPGSGPFVDPADGEVLWRWGRYLEQGSTEEPAGNGSMAFHHRPLGDIVTAAAEAGWALAALVERSVGEAAAQRDPLLAAQRHVPRLLAARWVLGGPG